jgi:hypothetical protein
MYDDNYGQSEDQWAVNPYQTGEDHEQYEEGVTDPQTVDIQTSEEAGMFPDELQALNTPTNEFTDQPQEFAPPKSGKFAVAQDIMTLAQAASSGDSETILNAMEKFSKSQLVRFLDIAFIGPALIFWAYRGKLSTIERTLMGLIGAGTVVYNYRNYVKNKEILQPEQIQAIKQELTSNVLSGR